MRHLVHYGLNGYTGMVDIQITVEKKLYLMMTNQRKNFIDYMGMNQTNRS